MQRPSALLIITFAGLALSGPANAAMFASGPTDALNSTPLDALTWTTAVVDDASFTGYDNTMYASTGGTAYIAYRRFTEDPWEAEIPAAELRVAKTVDGGMSWTIQVLDPSAPEGFFAKKNAVALDGVGSDVIYVAYLVWPSGYYSDMQVRVARTLDGGVTWTSSVAVDGFGLDFLSLKVVDPWTAYLTGGTSGLDPRLVNVRTTNGGLSWTQSTVASDDEHPPGVYSSTDAVGNHVFVSYYNAWYPDRSDLNFAVSHDGGVTWSDRTIDDDGGRASSIAAADERRLYISYEDSIPGLGSAVKVARSEDGGESWVPITIPDVSGAGWDTEVRAEASGHVAVAYYKDGGLIGGPFLLGGRCSIQDALGPAPPPTESDGCVRLAESFDHGLTWRTQTVPRMGFIVTDLSMDMPTGGAPCVAYKTQEGGNPGPWQLVSACMSVS